MKLTRKHNANKQKDNDNDIFQDFFMSKFDLEFVATVKDVAQIIQIQYDYKPSKISNHDCIAIQSADMNVQMLTSTELRRNSLQLDKLMNTNEWNVYKMPLLTDGALYQFVKYLQGKDIKFTHNDVASLLYCATKFGLKSMQQQAIAWFVQFLSRKDESNTLKLELIQRLLRMPVNNTTSKIVHAIPTERNILNTIKFLIITNSNLTIGLVSSYSSIND